LTFLFSSQYISSKWNISTQKANFFLGFIDLTSLALSPLFGFVVDQTGKKGYLGKRDNIGLVGS
jgi:hypothetical protein